MKKITESDIQFAVTTFPELWAALASNMPRAKAASLILGAYQAGLDSAEFDAPSHILDPWQRMAESVQ